MIFPNTSILDPDNGPTGFATPDFTMAAVPICGTKKYMIIAFGKQHEVCKDRKTAEIKLEQLHNASRKRRKGTKTPAKPKLKKNKNMKLLHPCGGKGSQGSSRQSKKPSTTSPNLDQNKLS